MTEEKKQLPPLGKFLAIAVLPPIVFLWLVSLIVWFAGGGVAILAGVSLILIFLLWVVGVMMWMDKRFG